MKGVRTSYEIEMLKKTIDTEISEFSGFGDTYDYMQLPTLQLNSLPDTMFINGTYDIGWNASKSDSYKFASLYFLKNIDEVTTYENLISAYIPIETKVPFKWNVPYNFVPGEYYIKIVSSFQNVEITDITPSRIKIISAKTPYIEILSPTGTVIPSRDDIMLMYAVRNNEYNHLTSFSLYYVDKNSPQNFISLEKISPPIINDYENSVYFSIPPGVDDFRLILSASSVLDGTDLSVYVPSVSGSNSEMFMHIEEQSILTIDSVGNNFTVTQNDPFKIEWSAKTGISGFGELVDVFHSTGKRNDQWELIQSNYRMTIVNGRYKGVITDVKLPLTYENDKTTIKIEWRNSISGRKHEFKKVADVKPALNSVRFSDVSIIYNNAPITESIYVNDGYGIDMSFVVEDPDSQIDYDTLRVEYALSLKPDIDTKLMDVPYRMDDIWSGSITANDLAKIGSIAKSNIKIKYFNKILEKEISQIITDIEFKVKDLRVHEIKIDGLYNNDKKTKRIFYNEMYILSGSLIGTDFSGNKASWVIKDDNENSIVGPWDITNNLGSNFEWDFNITPPKDFVGNTSIDFTGYNTWNKVPVSSKFPIELVKKEIVITNKDDIMFDEPNSTIRKEFYSVTTDDESASVVIDVNVRVNLPVGREVVVNLIPMSDQTDGDSKFLQNGNCKFELVNKKYSGKYRIIVYEQMLNDTLVKYDSIDDIIINRVEIK